MRTTTLRAAALAFAVAAAAGGPRAAAAQPVAPLSVAAPGFPAGFVLDQLSAGSTVYAAKALAEGSLAGSRAVRELQLLIANARIELREVADDPWDRLKPPQQQVLRTLDRRLQALPDPKAERGRLQDRPPLDVTADLAALPMSARTPAVRRIDGATQRWRADGSFQVQILTNLPASGAITYAVNIAGQPAPPAWLQVAAPDRLLLTLPAQALAPHFSERALAHLAVELTALMPKGSWKFWTSPTEPLRFPLTLELYPKLPFAYQLKEAAEGFVVDDKRTLVAKGRTLAVPGCGAPGCERDHMLCNDAPPGSKPVEPAFFTDSASADPAGGWTGAVSPSPGGFCAIFKQRSPTVARTIGFDVRYHPGQGERKTTPRPLRPQQPVAGQPPQDATAVAFDTPYEGQVAAGADSWELVLTAFNGQQLRAGSSRAPSSPLLKLEPPQRNGDQLRIGFSVAAPW